MMKYELVDIVLKIYVERQDSSWRKQIRLQKQAYGKETMLDVVVQMVLTVPHLLLRVF